MDEPVLAPGERVVRSYPCTAVDRVAMFAGTVVPWPGGVESRGVLTLTDRRLIFELGTGDGATARQEACLPSVSSLSSMMSKFGRDLRVPILFVVVGFILMFAPYMALYESGAFVTDGGYRDGYNDGVEQGYYEVYLGAVQSGTVSHTIPDGYDAGGPMSPITSEYSRGYAEGWREGVERARSDVEADSPFAVPDDLMLRGDPGRLCLALAIVGAAVFVTGSVLYLVSNRTKDWICIRLGSDGHGVAVRSFDGGWRATGHRALTAEERYWEMTRELGAAILEVRGYREHRMRFVDDVVIGEAPPEARGTSREMLEPAPDFDDPEGPGGELIVEDDEEGPRMVGPWGDRCPGSRSSCPSS